MHGAGAEIERRLRLLIWLQLQPKGEKKYFKLSKPQTKLCLKICPFFTIFYNFRLNKITSTYSLIWGYNNWRKPGAGARAWEKTKKKTIEAKHFLSRVKIFPHKRRNISTPETKHFTSLEKAWNISKLVRKYNRSETLPNPFGFHSFIYFLVWKLFITFGAVMHCVQCTYIAYVLLSSVTCTEWKVWNVLTSILATSASCGTRWSRSGSCSGITNWFGNKFPNALLSPCNGITQQNSFASDR